MVRDLSHARSAASVPPGVIRWGRLPVPYVASWSSEAVVRIRPEPLFNRRPALFRTGRRGLGTPRFGLMDEARTRVVVVRQLCQVCARPLRGAGIVCDVPITRTGAGDPILQEPPACERCFTTALALCPGIARLIQDPKVIYARVRAYDVAVAPLIHVEGGTPEVNAALATWQGPPPIGYARVALTNYELLDVGSLQRPQEQQ